MNTITELPQRAVKFDLGLCRVYNRLVAIEARDQGDGTRKWILKMDGYVMTHYGCFVWEPLPSSRSDEFIKMTRFNTADECQVFWVCHITQIKELFQTIEEMKRNFNKKIFSKK
mgnify:CR=1 FL=1